MADVSTKNIIIRYSTICAAVAIQPIPFADIFILTPIQGVMAVEIARKYGIKVEKDEAFGLFKQIVGLLGLGFITQQLAIAAAKTFFPIFGGITTIPVVFGLSYAIGNVMDEYYKFRSEGLELTKESMEEILSKTRREGEDIGRNLKKEDLSKVDTNIDNIEYAEDYTENSLPNDAGEKSFKESFINRYGNPEDNKGMKLPVYLEETINKTNGSYGAKFDSDCLTKDLDQDKLEKWKERWEVLNSKFKENVSYSNLEECISYNTFYLPSNFLKLHTAFYNAFISGEIDRSWFESKKVIRVLDVGSGPGTNVLAFLDFCMFLEEELGYKIPKIEFTIIERSKYFIEILNKNIDNIVDNLNLWTIYFEYKIEEIDAKEFFPNFRYDLIVFGNFLCEQNKQEQNKLFSRYQKKVKEDGLLLIIESNRGKTDIKDLRCSHIPRYITGHHENIDIIYGKCPEGCKGCKTESPCPPEAQIKIKFNTPELVKNSQGIDVLSMNGFIICTKKKN